MSSALSSSLQDMLAAAVNGNRMSETPQSVGNKIPGQDFITDTMEAENIANTAKKMAEWANTATGEDATRKWMAVAATREMALDHYATITSKLSRTLPAIM